MEKKVEKLSICISPEEKEKLYILSKKYDITMSQIVRRAVKEFLDNNEGYFSNLQLGEY